MSVDIWWYEIKLRFMYDGHLHVYSLCLIFMSMFFNNSKTKQYSFNNDRGEISSATLFLYRDRKNKKQIKSHTIKGIGQNYKLVQ